MIFALNTCSPISDLPKASKYNAFNTPIFGGLLHNINLLPQISMTA